MFKARIIGCPVSINCNAKYKFLSIDEASIISIIISACPVSIYSLDTFSSIEYEFNEYIPGKSVTLNSISL